MKPRVGITMPQFTDGAARFEETAQAAEELGVDSMWVFDHMWPLSGGKERPILECWTALAWLAGRTRSSLLGTMVTRSTLRLPALIAKMTGTLGEIAPERIVIAIGSGDELSRDENEAFDLPYFGGSDRTDQLRSVVDVLVSSLTGERVTRDDDFVTLRDFEVSPVPPLRPQVWVGGRSDHALEIAVDLADGWNGWGGTPERFATQAASLRERRQDLSITWAGTVVLESSDAAARSSWDKEVGERVIGGPETVAEGLGRYVSAGAEHLILTHGKGWTPERLRILTEEVRPLLS